MYKAFKRKVIPFWASCRKLDTFLFRHSHPIEPRRPNIRKQLTYTYRMKQASGSFLIDTNGNSLLDLNIGAQAPLGYNSIALVESQLATSYDSSILNSFSLKSSPPEKFADFLRRCVMPVAPQGLKSVVFTPSASEAIQSAIKAVFEKKGKGVALTFEGTQHGDTVATSNLSKLYNWPSVKLPASILPFWQNQNENQLREEEALEEVIRIIEDQERAGEPVRAILIQPINKHDLNSASGDFYKLVMRAAQQRDVAVIIDEAHCCFGATGEFWSYKNWLLEQDEAPEFLIFGGRAQASGYFTKFEMRSSSSDDESCDLRKVIQFSTIWQEMLYQKTTRLVGDAGTILKVELARVGEDMPWLIHNLRGQGSLIAFDCNSPDIRDSLVRYLEISGVMVGLLGENSIVLRPALTLNAYQAGILTSLVKKFDKTLARNIEAGFYS